MRPLFQQFTNATMYQHNFVGTIFCTKVVRDIRATLSQRTMLTRRRSCQRRIPRGSFGLCEVLCPDIVKIATASPCCREIAVMKHNDPLRGHVSFYSPTLSQSVRFHLKLRKSLFIDYFWIDFCFVFIFIVSRVPVDPDTLIDIWKLTVVSLNRSHCAARIKWPVFTLKCTLLSLVKHPNRTPNY